jgi:hypothetical protein
VPFASRSWAQNVIEGRPTVAPVEAAGIEIRDVLGLLWIKGRNSIPPLIPRAA